jgi:hypothetical protein
MRISSLRILHAAAGLAVALCIACDPAAAEQAAPPGNQAQPTSQAPEAQAPKPANIDRNGVLMLVRSTLLALDQGREEGADGSHSAATETVV